MFVVEAFLLILPPQIYLSLLMKMNTSALLLLALLLLVVHGNAVLRYAQATADALHQPRLYIEAVRGTRPVPGAARGSP